MLKFFRNRAVRKLRKTKVDVEIDKLITDVDIRYEFQEAVRAIIKEKLVSAHGKLIDEGVEKATKTWRLEYDTVTRRMDDIVSTQVVQKLEIEIFPAIQKKVTDDYVEKNLVKIMSGMDLKAVSNGVTLSVIQRMIGGKKESQQGLWL